jgi:RNA polymerase sigma factor (sigma-70 family)
VASSHLTNMEVMTTAIDRDLAGTVESAAGGDEIAFARIVAAYHGEMTRVCVVVARDRTIAEEAVQAAWLIAWRKLGKVRDPARVRPWLVSIAVNEVKQSLRKQRRRSQFEIGMEATGMLGGDDPGTASGSLDLRRALQGLDPDDRALLAMRYVAGFNSTELSTAIGLTPSGTRNRLERLLKRLRQELTDG